jgi:CxxC motif-containing protein (DUF1111 family)
MGVAGEDDTEDGTHGDAAAIRDLLRERLEVGREGDGDAVIPDTRSTSAAAFGSGVDTHWIVAAIHLRPRVRSMMTPPLHPARSRSQDPIS